MNNIEQPVIDECKNKISDLLNYAKQAGVDEAEVSMSIDLGYSVEARNGQLETCEQQHDKSLSITVYSSGKQGAASTSDCSQDAINLTVDKARSIAAFTQEDPYAGLAERSLMAATIPELDLYHPWAVSRSDIIQLALDCDQKIREVDVKIQNSDGAEIVTSNRVMLYANTHGFIGCYRSSYHQLCCSAVAKQGDEMQSSYEYTAACSPEKLQLFDEVAVLAAQRALNALGSRPIKTQNCPVIFHAPVAKSLLSHCVKAFSGGALYRKSSFLLDQLEQSIFPNDISIYQQPHQLAMLGSAPFDADGVATSDLTYVSDGRLVQYALSSYSARKLGLKTTGNSGGVFNLEITSGEHDLKQLCQLMGRGLLVTELIGSSVNIMTGHYSRGAAGFWVDNGEIQYPVNEVTVAGNLKDMYLSLLQVGNDLDIRGNLRTGSWLLESMTVAGL